MPVAHSRRPASPSRTSADIDSAFAPRGALVYGDAVEHAQAIGRGRTSRDRRSPHRSLVEDDDTASRGFSGFRSKPIFFGLNSRRRWMVFAYRPVVSVIRLAALPVGAASNIRRPFFSRMRMMPFTSVVFPVPGPPVIESPPSVPRRAGSSAAPRTRRGRARCRSGWVGSSSLPPGLYKSTSSLAVSSGDLTLDAKGNANAVFIFQMASTLTTTSGRQVILKGGAKASNVFWQVGSSATLGTTSVYKGTIMADQAITLNTGATLDGRALARIAAVALDTNAVTRP